jgi:hypothetical protein
VSSVGLTTTVVAVAALARSRAVGVKAPARDITTATPPIEARSAFPLAAPTRRDIWRLMMNISVADDDLGVAHDGNRAGPVGT